MRERESLYIYMDALAVRVGRFFFIECKKESVLLRHFGEVMTFTCTGPGALGCRRITES